MDLFARLKWGSIFMLAGYVLAKLMMRLNGIVPRGIAARVFNGIDTGLFYLMICISAFVAAGIVATILVNHFKEKKKAKEKLAEDERQKTREMKWKKEREEETLQKRLEEDEKDRQLKLELKIQKLAVAEYQKKRSAEESNKDSLKAFL